MVGREILSRGYSSPHETAGCYSMEVRDPRRVEIRGWMVKVPSSVVPGVPVAIGKPVRG